MAYSDTFTLFFFCKDAEKSDVWKMSPLRILLCVVKVSLVQHGPRRSAVAIRQAHFINDQTQNKSLHRSRPYIVNDCVISYRVVVQSRVVNDAKVERDRLVWDGWEPVAETKSIGTSDVSIPLEQSRWFPHGEVDCLVKRRHNWRVNIEISAARHLQCIMHVTA